jgi:hypothetical protein
MFRHRGAIHREFYNKGIEAQHVNLGITLTLHPRHDTHHMLHVDEMPSDHIRTRQVFVCIL